jgi:opacity protein-like surface antigen
MKSALCLGLSLSATAIASAQADWTARRGTEIAPFMLTSLLSPDWGQTRNLGFTAGIDYTRFLRSVVQPSLELRFSNAPGINVGEHSFTGGLKIATTIHGIHPYATMLAGTGGITFMNPVDTYGSDTSVVYSLGGGVELNVRPQWKLRADYSRQHWNLDPQTLTPTMYSVGVAYTIPFHGAGGWVH